VKLSASANELANALALAAGLINRNVVALNMPGLLGARLTAADDTLVIGANVLDHMLSVNIAADVAEPGELAVSAARLAGLVAGFPSKAMVEIATDGPVARIASARSRFRLPAIARDELPPPLRLVEELGRTELAREEALALLRPSFAMSTAVSQYYLGGIHLRDDAAGLSSVATDGKRLARITVPGITGLSNDARLIVPLSAIEIVAKLLRDKTAERLKMRRSPTLFTVESAHFTFISKLIDAVYPTYQHAVPAPSGNAVTVDRGELIAALDRIAAVSDPSMIALAGLTWSEGQPTLHLACAGQPGLATEELGAETTGAGKTALNVKQLLEMLDAFDGEQVRIDSNGPGSPALVLDLAMSTGWDCRCRPRHPAAGRHEIPPWNLSSEPHSPSPATSIRFFRSTGRRRSTARGAARAANAAAGMPPSIRTRPSRRPASRRLRPIPTLSAAGSHALRRRTWG